ncbi:hypothetical protein [uncultured Sphaerochaeta sp.]|uniref:hypothetical protein n=1 Tax=uncultured Sphaerochaeta sp. TaxID=886478 RepID=UPI002A0A44AB|nr:hypothetical protein [uncultured Sphaerochaeta sp.]
MKPILKSFVMFLRQVLQDSMLVIVCLASLLAAFFFRFGIPQVELLLCSYFGSSSILAPYYLLFDLMLGMLTPFMFCFASAMVMLEEYDVNLSSYLSVTPLGKKGYLISRLGLPALVSCLLSLLLLKGFSLTDWTAKAQVWTTLLSSLSAIIEALLVFSYSRNKVEGMAVAKLSGLLMLGFPIPFFLHTGFSYCFAFLPSYWIARYALEENFNLLVPGLLLSMAAIVGIYRKFQTKLT